jgi:hypothetical protein
METIKANGVEELEKNPFSIKDVLCLIIDRYVKRYNLRNTLSCGTFPYSY